MWHPMIAVFLSYYSYPIHSFRHTGSLTLLSPLMIHSPALGSLNIQMAHFISFFFIQCHLSVMPSPIFTLFKISKCCPDKVVQLVEASSHTLKGCRFNPCSAQDIFLGLQALSPVGAHMGNNQLMFLSLSLFLYILK